MISKQRSNLIKKLSFYLLVNTQNLKDLEQNKKLLRLCMKDKQKIFKGLTNKEIKKEIERQEAIFYLPF